MLRLVVLSATAALCQGACVYGKFTEWTKCSEPCSGGVQSRYRAGVGDTCEPHFIERPCNTQTCTPPTLDPFENHLEFLPNAGTKKLTLSGITTGGDEDQTLRIDAFSSDESVVGDLKVRYRDPETTGEVSYTVKGAGKATIRVMVIDSGSNRKGPQFGGSEINIVVKAPKVYCKANEFVKTGVCVPCPLGKVHAAGADTAGPDTECKAEKCKENERVLNNRCVPCLPGEQHSHDADPSTGNTECEAIICNENEFVENFKCLRCPAGKTRPAGDPANSYNTFCDEVNCAVNQILQANKCVDCPKGQSSHGGQETECETTVCESGERVKDFKCETCPVGYKHDHAAEATGGDTECELLQCRENESFDGSTCVSCPPGHSHPGQSSIFDDVDCEITICNQNEEHNGEECVKCPPGSHSPGGHTAGDDDLGCQAIVCAENERVQGKACSSCPVGHTSKPGHSADGGDTDCEILFCPENSKVVGNGCVSCDVNHVESSDPNAEDGCKQAVRMACGEADVMFIMDMSGSIGQANFDQMKSYVKTIAETLGIRPDGAHAALLTFADEAIVQFDYDAGTNMQSLIRSVDSLQYRPGRDTFIDKGLKEATRFLRAHSEAGTAKIVILLTDGMQTGGGKDVLPAAAAPLFALGVHVVAIGMGEEVDPMELELVVDDPADMVLSDYARLEEQIEVLALRICTNTNHGGPGADDPMGGAGEMGEPPMGGPNPTQHELCQSMNGTTCRASRDSCDWCRFRDLCAGKGMCPGGRRSPDLPDPATLDVCACTPSGPRFSSVSESHFCWLQETPCKGHDDEVMIQQWADCGDVSCPASGPGEKRHPYTPPHLVGKFQPRDCYDLTGPRGCKAESQCSWCPAFKGCAPQGKCKTLKGNKGKRGGKGGKGGSKGGGEGVPVVALSDVYEYVFAEDDTRSLDDCVRSGVVIVCDDGREYNVDANGMHWPVAAKSTKPTKSFRETLSAVMAKTLGAEEDPTTGQRCLSTENFCDMEGQEYCCQWQSDLVHFYRQLNKELGPSTDALTQTRCATVDEPCSKPGQEYCCEWQTSLVTMFA